MGKPEIQGETNILSNSISGDCNRNRESNTIHSQPRLGLQSYLLNSEHSKPRSLLNLCLGVVGSNLEEIIDCLSDLAVALPPDVKLVLLAIARRRKLLDDEILIPLADSSWEAVDLSGSDVSDAGLSRLVNVSRNLKALDISCCRRLTSEGVSEMLKLCHSLETLRWGGSPECDHTARRCLSLLKPKLDDVEGESWEDLDSDEFNQGAALHWLVWPNIDKESVEAITADSPRIVVNPKPFPSGFRIREVPREAVMESVLDDPVVEGIDPKTWSVCGASKWNRRPSSAPALHADVNEIPIAEKFRLAFEERDSRLATKRAKNARQYRRRVERERAMTDWRIKATVLASKAAKSLNLRVCGGSSFSSIGPSPVAGNGCGSVYSFKSCTTSSELTSRRKL